MTTSGTVAATVIDTSVVIDHALRRCGYKEARQTPEIVQTALECLYLFITGLANQGINLWCVNTYYKGLVQGKRSYALPDGTIDLLNLVYSQPTRLTGTEVVTSNSVAVSFAEATQVVRAGFKFSSVTANDTVTLAYSSNGIDYTTAATLSGRRFANSGFAVGEWYWLPAVVAPQALFWRLSTGSASTFAAYWAGSVSDIDMTIFNRDNYMSMPNKDTQGKPCTNYLLEKLLTYQATLWPVPNNEFDHLTIYAHRQVEDIGSLSQQLAIPQRSYEAIIWELAKRLAFELEGVGPMLRKDIIMIASEQSVISGFGETDGAPMRIQPRISGYTR